MALGCVPCRCMQVLNAWRTLDRKYLPEGLRSVLPAREQLRQARDNKQWEDPLLLPISQRIENRIVGAVSEVIQQCDYRRSKSSWAGGGHYDIIQIGDPNISGDSARVWSSNNNWVGTNSRFYISVPVGWYLRVYQPGLAIVGGRFILDILDIIDRNDMLVLAGKQGRGFNIYPARAVIRNGILKFV